MLRGLWHCPNSLAILSIMIVRAVSIKATALIIKVKGLINIISVNRDEAAYLRSKLDRPCIYRTVKQKSKAKRAKYFVEETNAVNKLLDEFRKNNQKVVYEYPAD